MRTRPTGRFITALLLTAPPALAQQRDLAPTSPAEAYQQARDLALAGQDDSALTILTRLATEGAVVVFEAGADSAFRRATARPEFGRILAAIERARRPISHSDIAFELPERDLIPEGTAWDPATRTLFLSSFYKRKIVAVADHGSARDFISSGQDGIGPVAGMEVDPSRRTLWAATMYLRELPVPLADTTLLKHGALYAYDLDTGKLRRRYLLPPSGEIGHGFNDLTVMPNGDVYTTDSGSGAVYRLPAGADSLVALAPPGTYVFPNGITRNAAGTALFVAHGAGIDRLDSRSGRRTRLGTPDTLNLGWVDGLAYYQGSLIAHQPSTYRRVFRVYLDRAETSVVRSEIIERHHPRFAQPTTGEIAGDTYYYIANAQLRRFRDGKIFAWSELDPVLILKTRLR
jgi:hypothetical protein